MKLILPARRASAPIEPLEARIAPAFASVFDLASLDVLNGFQVRGESPGDGTGESVKAAGDVNGDGFADFIIGAANANRNGTNSGAAFVIFGKPGGFNSPFELGDLDGTNGFQIKGEAGGDFFGYSVSGAGDVNNDGKSDIIIGAYGAGSLAGSSYVVFGAAAFPASIEASGLNGTNGFKLLGESAGDRSGESVSGLGDFNNDGFGDVLIGASGDDDTATNSGAAYVVFGGSGFGSTVQLSAVGGATPGVKIVGTNASDFLGTSVSSAADVNNDLVPDLIIGAPGADPNGTDSGAAYVIFGGGTFPSVLAVSSLLGSNGFAINGAVAASRAGTSVSAMTDFNGDTYGDVIIGAPFASVGTAGATYVVFGGISSPSFIELSTLSGSDGFKIQSQSANEAFAVRVSNAGDVNADGMSDLIASATDADTANGTDSGAAYVIYGTATSPSALNLSALDGSNGFQVIGATAGDFTGASVSAAGDVNNDGVADFLISSILDTPNGASTGKTFVVYGQPMTDIDVSIDSRSGGLLVEDTAGAHTHAMLTFALNGADLVISDPTHFLKASAGVTQFDAHTVTVPLASIAPVIGVNGGDGDDTVVLDYSGGDFIQGAFGFLGGTGYDELLLTNGTASNVSIQLTTGAGSEMTYDSKVVQVDGTESLYDNRDVLNLAFIGSGTASQSLNLSDQNNGITDLIIGGGNLIRFRSPTIGLALLGSDGNETITIDSYSPFPGSILVIDGGLGSDSIVLNSALSVERLQLDAETFSQLPSLTLGLGGAEFKGATAPFAFVTPSTLGFSIADSGSFFTFTSVAVIGEIAVSGVTFALNFQGTSSAPHSDFSLINNDSTDPIVGTFNGLPEGSGILLGNTPYIITYVGGDGNDVVLQPRPNYGSSDLSDLDGTNGFSIPGLNANDLTGSSLTGLGDINGDGIDDFAVGSFNAFDEINDSNDAGATYVIFGTGSILSPSFDLSSLDGTNGFRIDGELSDDNFGTSIAAAGDVNDDGIADIIIGAPDANSRTGAAYVVFGSTSPFSATLNLADLTGTDGFRIDGELSDDNFGTSVSGAGDVNGDGFDDVIVGAPRETKGTSFGKAYVLFGKATAFSSSISASTLSGTVGFISTSDTQFDRFGSSVAGVGDINGDGFDDVAIGAPFRSVGGVIGGGVLGSGGGSNLGVVYVIFGKAGNFETATLNGKNGFTVFGDSSFQYLGTSVATAGDLNGDKIDDLILGGSGNSGTAFVIFGKKKGWSPEFDLSALNGNNGFKISGSDSNDHVGISVAGGGDFNGDGITDLLVGANGTSQNGFDSGAAHLIFGRRAGFTSEFDLTSLNGTNGNTYLGISSFNHAGQTVAFVGDVNDDGLADILIGAPLVSVFDGEVTTSQVGESYLIFGKASDNALPKSTAGGTTVTFTDVDGDDIVVKVTNGTINPDMFTFGPAGDLLLVNLNIGGTIKQGANITFSVNKRGGGDGILNVGAITVDGINLGKITITGDLGQIDITGTDPLKPAIKQLIVGSFGMNGSANQIPGVIDPLVSTISGTLLKLIVKHDIHLATINITGALGNATIGGNFDGNGALTTTQLTALGRTPAHVSGGTTLASSGLNAGSIGKLNVKSSLNNAAVNSTGKIGNTTVGGSLNNSAIVSGSTIGVVKILDSIIGAVDAPSIIAALGTLNPTTQAKSVAISSLTVKKNVLNAEILIGYTDAFVATNPDVSLGKVTVNGTWSATSLAVGVADPGNDGFGRNDALIADAVADTIISKIASLTIQGLVTSSPNATDSYAITAQTIDKAKISGQKVVLNKLLLDDILVTGTDDLRIKEIAI